MRDVAELAHVGTMTVSRVINDGAHVTAETRKRVLDAIAKLNYRPNAIARSLRKQRSSQIGIIVPDLEDPFFAICAQAVSVVAKEHAYSVSIAISGDDPDVVYDEAILMVQRHIEGLVVIPAIGNGAKLASDEFSRMPIVTLDRQIPNTRFDSVVVKNKEGAEVAVQHLIDLGHRRIACLGLSAQLKTIKDRSEGYLCAMKKARLKPELYYGNSSRNETLRIIRTMVSSKNAPTAVFCSNNLVTKHALHALHELNLRVPDHISLVGFDDFETADLLDPAITVVRQPIMDMGRMGAHLLFSRLSPGTHGDRGKRIVLPVELIVRESCGIGGRSLKAKD